MERSDVVRRRMDEMALRRAVRMYIGPFLSEAELDELVSDAKIRRINAGDDFFKKGDEADGLYLIRRGSVTILRTFGGKEVVMTYVAAGNYVGEMALLDTNARRTATVRAAVNCEAIVLPASHFTEVMRRNPTLRSSVEARARERVSQNVESETGARTGNLIDFLVNQGLGEGTDVLLIDESLCIRFDNCEKACADVHNGISRLDRQAGPTFSNIHVPTSCRHCENPQCMKDCPPDAIHRDLQGEVVIDTLTCIGCGNCESNCPYGVIKLAQIKMNRKPPSLWAWLLLGASAEPGRENHNYDDSIAKKAVKCDMCKDLPGGAACVRACPTGAAIRVRPEVFMKYAAK
jgi:Fe-S-cluster-containing dehydrogenase component